MDLLELAYHRGPVIRAAGDACGDLRHPSRHPVVLVPPLLPQRPDVRVQQFPLFEDSVVPVLTEDVRARARRRQCPQVIGEFLVGPGPDLAGLAQPPPVVGLRGQQGHLMPGEPDVGHALGQAALDDQSAGQGRVEITAGVVEHVPDAVQAGDGSVGELVLGPHGQEEELGDAGLEVALGRAPPLLPVGHGHPPVQSGDDQRPIDGLVEREGTDVEIPEAPDPRVVVGGAAFEPGCGQIVEAVVEAVPTHDRRHPGRFFELSGHELADRLFEGIGRCGHLSEYKNPSAGRYGVWRRSPAVRTAGTTPIGHWTPTRRPRGRPASRAA